MAPLTWIASLRGPNRSRASGRIIAVLLHQPCGLGGHHGVRRAGDDRVLDRVVEESALHGGPARAEDLTVSQAVGVPLVDLQAGVLQGDDTQVARAGVG